MRRVVYPLLALGLATATMADAAPPVCNIISDRAGDAPGALDIVTGDVSSGKKEFVATLRLTSSEISTLTLIRGASWTLVFSAGPVNHTFRFDRKFPLTNPLGPPVDTWSGPGDTTAEFKNNAITWRTKRGEIFPKGNMHATNFSGTSYIGGGSSGGDLANSLYKYKDQTPSCLKAS